MRTGIKKYQQIDPDSRENADGKQRDALILEYAPLVNEIAGRMAMRLPPNISKEELVGPGIMGLFDAIDKFDPQKGIKFRTYANLRIKGAILDELRKMDWVSRSTRRNISRTESAIRILEQRLEREPEDVEIAEELGITIDSYYKMVGKAQGVNLLSLDEVMLDGVTPRLFGQASNEPSPFDKLKIKEIKHIISISLSKLSKKEQLVLSLYYYDELTLKEIAKVLNLTESRISQIHSKAIIRLRVKLRSYFED